MKRKYFKSFGQSERLVDRIKDLIEGYGDGLDVFKELIQNADDAGATQIKICLDLRKNKNWNKNLFSPQMDEIQNDCFWIFNNAYFTENDFDNIIRLGGRHKVKKSGVIGKFGLGFNSIYNITDVPSILSQNKLAMFDPNGKYIPEDWMRVDKPGILIELDSDEFTEQLNQYKDQFSPYDQMFGCKIFQNDNKFDGTLIRLPFRKSSSEISKVIYNENRARNILKILFDYAETLLLFTQNVCEFEVYSLVENQKPNEMQQIFRIEKSSVKFNKKHGKTISITNFCTVKQEELIKQTNILTVAGCMINSDEAEFNILTSYILKIKVSFFASNLFPELKTESSEFHWLQTATCSSYSNELNNDSEFNAYLPCTGISIKLKLADTTKFSIDENGTKGLVFCFLPLPKQTNIKFHLNGNFLLNSTRENMVNTSNDRIDGNKSNWNDLIKKCLARTLVESCKIMNSLLDFEMLDWMNLWPTNLNSDFDILVTEFIRQVFDYEQKHKIFKRNKKIYSINECKILKLTFKNEMKDEAQKVMQEIEKNKFFVLILSESIWQVIRSIGVPIYNIIEDLDFCEKFITNIFEFSKEDVIKILKYLLSDYSYHVKKGVLTEIGCLIRDNQCIPTNLKGKFMKPCELINRYSKVSELYDSDKDDVFPDSELLDECKNILIKMGLISDFLPSSMILERINFYKKHKKLKFDCWHLVNQYLLTIKNEPKTTRNVGIQEDIRKIKFIKAKQPRKNLNNSFKWFIDNEDEDLWSLEELYDEKSEKFIFSVGPIFDTSKIDKDKKQLIDTLKLRKHDLKDSIEHFKQIQNEWLNMDGNKKSTLAKDVYSYFLMFIEWLNINYSHCKRKDLGLPDNFFFLKIDEQYNYHNVENLAIEVKNPSNLLMIKLPDDIISKVSVKLLLNLGVAEKFNTKYLLNLLSKIFTEHVNGLVDKDTRDLCINIVKELDYVCDISKHREKIYLPDTNNVLRLSEDLCLIDDSKSWLLTTQVSIVNDNVPIGIAKKLGIIGLQTHFIKRFMHGFEFGQQEPLKYRIRKLLESYPNFFDIFKELIQNADDAGASEIIFILDQRTHGTDKIFSKEFSQLQGPALCCYNNKTFSYNDFQALKNLGVGNKAQEKIKIGKYGVGFNTVYHLTDAPQLLSNMDNYLIFDPLCQHFPDLEANNPGWRICVENEAKNPLIEYSDIIKSFTGHFSESDNLKNGTMFRFALRNKKSQLSESVFSIDDIEKKILEKKIELKNSIIFLKNIKKLSVKKIDINANVETILNIEKQFETSDCENEYLKFIEYFEASSKKKIADIAKQIFHFNIKINDGSKDVIFRIINQIGFDCQVNFNSEGKYFPLASIAIPISVEESKDFSGTLYCFLPLTISSPMPYHINGYFALVNESRQSLIKKTDMQSEKLVWNQHIFSYILSSLFFEAVKFIKNFYREKYNENPKLIEYHFTKYFPFNRSSYYYSSDTTLYMPEAVKRFYETFANQTDEDLMPILKSDNTIDWIKIKDTNLVSSLSIEDFLNKKFCSYNNNNNSDIFDKICTILLKYGLKLCTFKNLVNLINSEYGSGSWYSQKLIKPINGTHILSAFKYNNAILGSNISDTYFQTAENLTLILEFLLEDLNKRCSNIQEINSQFDNTSLLLDGTSRMKMFFSKNPIYFEAYYDIFEGDQDKFLHEKLLPIFRNENLSIIKKLDIKTLNDLFPNMSDKDVYWIISKDCFDFEKYPEMKTETINLQKCINNVKLDKIWKIIGEIINRWELQSQSRLSGRSAFINYLSSISNWAIIPVQFLKNNRVYLAPINAFDLILSKRALPDFMPKELKDLINACDLPALVDSSTLTVYNRMALNLNNIEDIIDLLKTICNQKNDVILNLDSTTRKKCLNYLAGNLQSEALKAKFLSLKMFINAFNEITSISNKNVLIIDSGISLNGLQSLFPSDSYFLMINDVNLQNFKTLFNDKIYDFSRFYQTFLSKFDLLDSADKYSHIKAMKDRYSENRLSDSLIEKLRYFKFMESSDHQLYQAGHFYNPKTNSHKILLSNMLDKFPTQPYDTDEWIPFLSEIGLQGDSIFRSSQSINEYMKLASSRYESNEISLHELCCVLDDLYKFINRLFVDSFYFVADEFKNSVELFIKYIKENNDDEIISKSKIIFNTIYKILTKFYDNQSDRISKFYEKIKQLDIILHKIEKGDKICWRLNSIDKFVEFNLKTTDEIDDFLYIFPDYLFEFKQFFSKLGLNYEVDYELCLKVLKNIYSMSSKNQEANDYNLKRSSMQAMNLLFKCASNVSQSKTNKNLDLYLLNGDFELKKANELYYVDKSSLNHLYKCEFIKKSCLISLNEFTAHFEEFKLYGDKWSMLIIKLNEHDQPKPLSIGITTELISDDIDRKCYSELENKVHNRVFISSLKDILDITDDRNIDNFILNMKFYKTSIIKTRKRFHDVIIDDSEFEERYFAQFHDDLKSFSFYSNTIISQANCFYLWKSVIEALFRFFPEYKNKICLKAQS